jgi:hypothetical protein
MRAAIERFRPNQQILRGYDAEHFYLIHHGKVALETAYVPGEGSITIQTLGAGGRSVGLAFFLLTSGILVRGRSSRPKPSSSGRMHCVTKQKKPPLSDTILPCGWVP